MSKSDKNKKNFFLNQYKNNLTGDHTDDTTDDDDLSASGIIKKPSFEKLEVKQPSLEQSPRDTSDTYSKKHLSALFLILSGVEKAARIIKQFSENEISIVTYELLHIQSITRDEFTQVEAAFGSLQIDDLSKQKGGKEFVRQLLQAAFGVSEGSTTFIRVVEEAEQEERDFSFLERLPIEKMAGLLNEESEMVTALICSLMDSSNVANYLATIKPDRAAALVKRMSEKLEIQPDVLQTVREVLQKKAAQLDDPDAVIIPGKQKLAEILKNIDPEQSSVILEELAETDPDLAEDIEEQIFTFKDIAHIPKKEFEKALKGYADLDIAFLLKGADDNMKTIFLTCLTRRRREIVKDEIEYLGAVKRSDVVEKRKDFIAYLKRLEEEGTIILRPDNDIYVE